ncbi:hypothetical protein K503DRAFT_866034 [Rhizopogon vinicolor AM-OR11-026]|uniref:F-box domain-containing protein n=1 Tax=Rhizopogon vinicolor AM-OR11-026 TaxID=1314800 RepID=A0A1B7N165_9AGAM|nr:hypothetical protein K503DRAFT_866034 [Rhizopogon vinicolor AM-OR11-026]
MNCYSRHPCHINVLPVEILSYIFTLATHSTLSSTSDFKQRYQVPFSPDSVTMPTVLASVHRHWRHIALSTSTLWSSLVMSLEQVVHVKVGSDVGDEYTPRHTTFLDVQRLAAHIARSQNSPVDILIDTRDPDWDFEDDGEECPNHGAPPSPFAAFIPQILDLLFPQMYRWRSLTILSDTWAPLRVALECLSVPTVTKGSGAPHLETLMLMRCNEFLGHSDIFTPSSQSIIGGIPFAALMGDPNRDVPAQYKPLPKLRNITLVGVHLNWTDFCQYTLGAALDQPLSRVSGCIQSLELSQHCREVRATCDEFSRILKACPLLRRLVIRVSGPRFDKGIRQNDRLPVSLPMLEEIHVGYTHVEDAAMMLSQINAPNLVTLSIEDANPMASPDDEDAGPLVTYCATGLLDLCDVLPEVPSNLVIKPPFPQLERLSLNGVNACIYPFSLLMATLPKLRHLSLRRSPNALEALLPTQMPFVDACTRTIPCPGLESIEVICAEEQTRHTLDFVFREREQSGATRVCDVDIDLEVSDEGEEFGEFEIVEGDATGMQPRYGEWELGEADPFSPGGIFNDPEFDEVYHLVS